MSENEPFFEKIFGEDWATMPEVFHAHYANRTHRDDVVRVTGLMDIRQSWLMRLAAPLFRMTKTLVPVGTYRLQIQAGPTDHAAPGDVAVWRPLCMGRGNRRHSFPHGNDNTTLALWVSLFILRCVRNR